MKLIKRIIIIIFCTVFIAIFISITFVCVDKVFGVYSDNKKLISMQEELKQYKPSAYYDSENLHKTDFQADDVSQIDITEIQSSLTGLSEERNTDESSTNRSEMELGLDDLQMINSDVFAWVELYDTDIDYPVTQYSDNQYYLKHNAKNEAVYYGSIFMDYRCSKDMSMFNSILYGHKLDEGGMFSSLAKYADEDFFNSHTEGILYSVDKNYKIDVFAYLMTTYDDEIIYNVSHFSQKDREEHLEYIRNKSIYYREIDDIQNIITLSTCSKEFDKARTVVIGKATVIE